MSLLALGSGSVCDLRVGCGVEMAELILLDVCDDIWRNVGRRLGTLLPGACSMKVALRLGALLATRLAIRLLLAEYRE